VLAPPHEPGFHYVGHLFITPAQAMVPALDPVQADRPSYSHEFVLEFGRSAESVPRTRDEKARQVQLQEVLSTETIGLARRVERVAHKDQSRARHPISHG
jgi:hypothetical protein